MSAARGDLSNACTEEAEEPAAVLWFLWSLCVRFLWSVSGVEEAEAKAGDMPTKITLFGREEDSFRRVERLRQRLGKGES